MQRARVAFLAGVAVAIFCLPVFGQRVIGAGNATSIQGVSVSATAPTDTQVLAYSGADKAWEPTATGGGTSIVKSAQYATTDQLTGPGTFATTYTIPANTLAAGSLIEIWSAGPLSITTGTNFKPGVTIGGVQAMPDAGQFLSAGVSGNWDLLAKCVVISVGATGTGECEGNTIATGAAANAAVAAATTFALNTTVALTVAIPLNMTAADGTGNLSQLIVVVFP